MQMNQQANCRLTTDKPGITVEFECRFQQKNGRKKVCKEQSVHNAKQSKPTHHIHQIAIFLALAHYYQSLIDDEQVKDYAQIARLTGTSRARITQIMDLTLLAPEIQHEILFLPQGKPLPKHVKEQNLRKVLKTLIWKEQRNIWKTF